MIDLEALIISYGDGRNGKSTFWNVIQKVVNNYGGGISAAITFALSIWNDT